MAATCWMSFECSYSSCHFGQFFGTAKLSAGHLFTLSRTVHFLFENYSVSVNFDSFEALKAGRFSRRRYLDVCLLERSKKRWEAEEDRQRGRESSEPPSFNRSFLYLSLSYVLTWISSRIFGEPKERRWESQRKERRRT